MSTLLEEIGQSLAPASIEEQQQQQQRAAMSTTLCEDSNSSSVLEDIDVSNTSSSSSTTSSSSSSSASSNSSSCSNGTGTDTDTGKGSSTVGSIDTTRVSSSSIGSAASITSSVSTTAPSTSNSSGLGLVVDVDSNIGSSQELNHGYDSKSVTETDSLEGTCNSILKDAKNCMLCSSRLVMPRILSCLHVFCEDCLLNLLRSKEAASASSPATSLSSAASCSSASFDGSENQQRLHTVLECPDCKQLTRLGNKGVKGLTVDYIVTNILDLFNMETEHIPCTSCKSKEEAISRCNDCANFLCNGCDNAHKYMRCFENHQVVRIEDLQKNVQNDKLIIHKPICCRQHVNENLKYYCFTCQVPTCNDCLLGDHKGNDHHYETALVAEQTVRADLEQTIAETLKKAQYCNDAGGNLSSALTELQSQHDNVRQQIEDAYKSYKRILEVIRDQLLTELGRLHSERELKIMDLMQSLENNMGRLQQASQFGQRAIEKANAIEFLLLKPVISAQCANLIDQTPQSDVNYQLQFECMPEKFERFAREMFGKFRTESTKGMNVAGAGMSEATGSPMTTPKQHSPPPANLAPGCHGVGLLPAGVRSLTGVGSSSVNNSSVQGRLSSAAVFSPISLPSSLQSSFDGDTSVMTNFSMMSTLPPDSPPQLQPQLQQQQQQQALQQVQQQKQQQQQQQALHQQPQALPVNQQISQMVTTQGIVQVQQSTGHVNINAGANNSAVGMGLGALNGLGMNAGGPTPPFSMLEYNLSRLASLTENIPDAMNDTLGVGSSNAVAVSATSGAAGGTASHHQQAVIPASGVTPTQPITLADILSGDQRALNNLQALAKLGLNNNDFCMPAATSPNLQTLNPIVGGVEEMSLNNFHAVAQPGTTSVVTGRNKATPMQIRCKFGSLGTAKGQFNSPHGFCLGVDEEIIVADTNNHRIEVFDKMGALKFQFGVAGKEEGQLWYPRKVAVMHNNGKFVVCDRGNERSRMQIFSKCGHFMRKIAIRYIDIVAGLAVTAKGHIVAVDSVSPTVFVISEEGELVRWFDCSDYMREPSDIAIRDNDFYVCDFKGHCVAVFQEDGTFLYRIGNEKVTCFPNGIDISNAGDVLIGDSHGNRFHVACYSREGALQSEFECPHVKVSRCCGLKITSEGYVVTLAKNNHHVLVLNTLYVH
ncbi:E3 ubiquitin-protein ligase TRIM33 isoform X2 [Drosophila hydei]|uniref:E3 ubiquitin-protein ligase TRIM33 isoform X2 n=1 Tax=Drosophila hydei TaxID=7224 RepID=A0A6J1M7R9_DROHY|nr:E3 ubiquitin-protein ligase TRIM33 isoform X2 [Drosophila hydei]